MTFAGWAEIGFIALLAFIIIGPNDLPKVLFKVGRWVRTFRQLSHEFIKEWQEIDPSYDGEEKNNHPKNKES